MEVGRGREEGDSISRNYRENGTSMNDLNDVSAESRIEPGLSVYINPQER